MSAPASRPCPAADGEGFGRFAAKKHFDWLAAESLRIAALFGLDLADATMIARHFRAHPEERLAQDLTNHAALLLRARKRFLAGSHRRARLAKSQVAA